MYFTWVPENGFDMDGMAQDCDNSIANACCSGINLLTHLPLDKMTANFAGDIFKCIFLNENDKIPI